MSLLWRTAAPIIVNPEPDMSPFFVYAPALIALPFLLIGGIFFIVIPGVFIIVLGLLFYAATAFVGMVGAAARTRRDARHASRRAAAPGAGRPAAGRAYAWGR